MLFDEVESRCPNPKCMTNGISELEIHHLDGDPSNNDNLNLLAICSNCHTRAEKGLIPTAELDLWKRMLTYGYHPRLVVAETNSTGKVISEVNFGQMAETINNTYESSKASKGSIILPGSIGSDPKRYNYLEYLIARLAKWRSAGKSYGQKRPGGVHPGVVRKQIQDKWGGLPKDLPLDNWESLVAELKDKIELTALGKNKIKKGQSNFHSYEAHGRK
ncbi:hypothetical protein SH580_17035 [Coraliomargarita algicola]|uniref:HNH nuclease domain-containing protein n=1 Tax=Coraliomargarita algicola TaxID=3092156 RepID=A0ABZ0RIC9_9BACT|nr:hypothetical protein [Coraliomargarita sp. J2-16]WPJ95131.1 hypothetical protein SH580_17035 [Coraliomargarita sp. J2-16]